MSRDDWWDALYRDGERDTDQDTATPRKARDKTRQDTTPRDTTHGPGRVLTLHRRPKGPRPLDELTTERPTPKPTPDTPPAATPRQGTGHRDTGTRHDWGTGIDWESGHDTETRPPSTSRAARRALRKATAQRATPADTSRDTETTEQQDPQATEQETEAPRHLGQRILSILGKAQDAAHEATTSPSPEATAEQERMAHALDQLTEALRPVEPTRTWAPNWFGTVGTVLLFNISAAAAGHYSAAQAGYPDLSPAVIIYDLVAPTAQGQYHWSSPLIFGAIPALACYLIIDRRARKRSSTILRWIARIPLATITAGALAATWHIIVHVTTGAPQ